MQPAVNRVLLVLLVAGVVFAALQTEAGETATGFLVFEKETYLSVQGLTAVDVTRFAFDPVITIGDSINISVELTNTGSRTVATDYNIEVYDANSTLLVSYPAPNITLQPGELRTQTVKHTPHDTGSYTISLLTEIGDDRSRTSEFLFVTEEPEPVQPDPGTVTVVRTEIEWIYPDREPVRGPTARRSWKVEAPRNVTVPQDGSASIPIQLHATGDAAIRNVRLSLQYPDNLSITYNPKYVFTIIPNRTKQFVLRVTPQDAARGVHELGYTVRSSRFTESGTIAVDVVPTLTLQQLAAEADRLDLLLARARAEIRSDRADGLQVDEADAAVRRARQELRNARDAIADQDVDAARGSLDASRDEVDEAFRILFKQRSEQVTVRAPLIQPVHLLIIASLLIAVVMVALYYRAKERYQRRPKLLRELEE